MSRTHVEEERNYLDETEGGEEDMSMEDMDKETEVVDDIGEDIGDVEDETEPDFIHPEEAFPQGVVPYSGKVE